MKLSTKYFQQVCLITSLLFPCVMVLGQAGKVGINTTTPAAMLHVKDSSVVFTGVTPLPNPPGNPPVSNGGSRFMWYPDKAAFRAGRVSTDEWNKNNIGIYSVAFGHDCKASGSSSGAMGWNNIASGSWSFVYGRDNIASGGSSVAGGNGCISTGSSSVSFGASSKASGGISSSFNFQTHANGEASSSFGWGTKANGYSSMVIGSFNDTLVEAQGFLDFDETTPLFIIGNGVSNTSRSNAMTVWDNGYVGVGASFPAYKLDVNGRMRIQSGGNNATAPGIWFNEIDNSGLASFFGMADNNHVGIFSEIGGAWYYFMNLTNGNVGIGAFPSHKLHVNGNGFFNGTVTASCGVLTCSDIRYKTNIRPLTNSLANVMMLQGIYYEWDKEKFKDRSFNDKRQIGLVAQDLEKIYPEMVHTDEEGYKTVDYTRLGPVLVEAMKEQQQMIRDQQGQIDILMTALSAIKSQLVAMNQETEAKATLKSEAEGVAGKN